MSNRKSARGTVFAWALWDWGGSAYSAVVVTFVFAPYLTKAVAGDEVAGSAALGWATGIAGLLVAVIAPASGTRSDARDSHRTWLAVSTGATVVCVLAMFFIKDSPGYLWPGLVLLGLAAICYQLAEVSYNGLLPRITTAANAGKVSGLGWGLGYLGGLAMLVLALFTLINPEVGLFGATDAGGLRYRLVAVMAGVWFAIFALPIIIAAPKRTVPAPSTQPNTLSTRPRTGVLRSWLAAYAHVLRRLVHLWRHERSTAMFFIASAVFRDGLSTIFAVAGVLAAGSFGFSATEVIYLGVAANLVAGIGCLLAGIADDRFGPKAVIVVGLSCLIIGCVPIALSDAKAVFWVCAMFLCLFVGPVQASSRSFLSRITPEHNGGENFGLYATVGRAASFIGPFCFATAISIFGFQRAGAWGVMLVLVAGLALMLPVGRPAAHDRT